MADDNDDFVVSPSRNLPAIRKSKRPALMHTPTICETLMGVGIDEYAAEDIEIAILSKADQADVDKRLDELSETLTKRDQKIDDDLERHIERHCENVGLIRGAQHNAKKAREKLEQQLKETRDELEQIRKLAEAQKRDYTETQIELSRLQERYNHIVKSNRTRNALLGGLLLAVVAALVTPLGADAITFFKGWISSKSP